MIRLSLIDHVSSIWRGKITRYENNKHLNDRVSSRLECLVIEGLTAA